MTWRGPMKTNLLTYAIARFLWKHPPPPCDRNSLSPTPRIQLAKNGFDMRLHGFQSRPRFERNGLVTEPEHQQLQDLELPLCQFFPPDLFGNPTCHQRSKGNFTGMNGANGGSQVRYAATQQQVTASALLQGVANTRLAVPAGENQNTIPPWTIWPEKS